WASARLLFSADWHRPVVRLPLGSPRLVGGLRTITPDRFAARPVFRLAFVGSRESSWSVWPTHPQPVRRRISPNTLGLALAGNNPSHGFRAGPNAISPGAAAGGSRETGP